MRKLVSMRQALQDPVILGSAFGSRPAAKRWFGKDQADTWLAWRALLIAIAGEALIRQERQAFEALTKRAKEPLVVAEEFIAIIGRRGGKTLAGAVLLTYLATLVDYSAVLNIGERAVALLLAQNQKQATISFNYISGIIDNSPMLKAMVVSRTADTISLANGVDIEVRSSSHKGVRGVTAVAILADELAFWSTEGVNTDTAVLNALRPSLATTGGMLIVLSSPYAKKGELFELHQRHYGPDGDPRIVVVQAASRDTNPSLPERVVARALERDAAAASAEYLGRFRDDVTGFIGRELLEAAVDQGVTSRPPTGNHVAFADAASGLSETNDGDSFALAIGHATEEGGVVIDLAKQWAPPFNASAVVGEIAGILREYGCDAVSSDGFSSGFMRSELARHGIGHNVSPLDKSGLYAATLPMLTSRKVRLLENKTLIDQFAALERRPGSNGRDRIDARGHEDLANAVAGVVAMLSATAPVAGWGVLEFMRREAAKVDQAAPPTLGREHAGAAVLQIGSRHPADYVQVRIVNDASTIIGISGKAYTTELIDGERFAFMGPTDALAMIDTVFNLEIREANLALLGELKARLGNRQQPRGIRVTDWLQAAEDQRPRYPFDKAGMALDALREAGWRL